MKRLVFLFTMLIAMTAAAAGPYTKIQLRRDTPANWTSYNPVLAPGEPGCELTGSPLQCTAQKIGDGVTHWLDLPYALVVGSAPWVDAEHPSFGGSLAAAAAYAVSTGKALHISRQWNITADTDLSSIPEVDVIQGGSFNITSGTLTLPINFHAGFATKVFYGSGAVAPGMDTARPEWWGVGGGDDAVAINKAVVASLHVPLRSASYHITTPLILRTGVTIEGNSLLNKGPSIFTSVSGDYSIKADGQTLGAGNHVMNFITLRNFRLVREGGNSTKGIRWTAVSNSHIDGVKIEGMNGGPSLHLIQVWDSWFDNGYDHSCTYGSGTVIEYGDTDNSNNLRFRGWTWETFSGSAVEVKAGTGTNNIYKVNFTDGCKWESGSSTSPFILVSAGEFSSSEINGGILTNINTGYAGNLIATTGTGVLKDVDFSSTEMMSKYPSAVTSLVSMLNSQNVRFDNVKFFNTGGFTATPVSVDAGSNRYSASNCSVNAANNVDIFSGTNVSAGFQTSTRLRVNRKISGTNHYLEVVPLSTEVDINTEDGTVLQIAAGNVGVGMVPTQKLEVGGVGQARTWGAKNTTGGTTFFGYRSSSPTDQKQYDIWQDDTGWYLRFLNDGGTSSSQAMKITRAGYTPTTVAFPFLTTNGFVKTTGGNGSLLVDTTNYQPMSAAAAPATTGAMTTTMSGSVITITPTGDCTFNASGGTAGQRVSFIVTTSGTTTRNLTWGTNFKSTGVLATGAVDAKVFTVSFVCTNGTTWVETSRTAAM